MAELDVETEMSRLEAATFLREFADELEGSGITLDVGEEDATTAEEGGASPDEDVASPETMTVIVGGESATVVLPERLDLDVEVGSRSGLLESGIDQRVAFEFTWEVEELPEDDSIEVV